MHTLLVDVDVDDELLIATGDDEALVPDDVPVCAVEPPDFCWLEVFDEVVAVEPVDVVDPSIVFTSVNFLVPVFVVEPV